MAAPTWDETEPLFDETEPVEETGVMDTLKQGFGAAQDSMANTPMGIVASGMDRFQDVADFAGERGAEELAGGGMNPTVAAGIGTAVQMAPSIVGSMIPTGGPLAKPGAASKAPGMLENVATDARARMFGVKPGDVAKTGELESVRSSVRTLGEQGIQPKLFETAEGISKRLKAGMQEPGQMVSEIPKKLDAHGIKPRLNEDTLPKYLEAELTSGFTEGAYASEGAIVKEIIDTTKGHSGSFENLLKLKQKLGEKAAFHRNNPATPEQAKLYRQAYHKVNEILDNEINRATPELGAAWTESNKIYSAGMDVLPESTKAMGKAAMTDPSQWNLQQPLGALKRPVNAVLAYGADKASRLVQSGSNALGQFSSILKNAAAQGPKAFAVTHYTLSQKSPEYRTMLEGVENED